jgi:hypothetical protein
MKTFHYFTRSSNEKDITVPVFRKLSNENDLTVPFLKFNKIMRTTKSTFIWDSKRKNDLTVSIIFLFR